MKNILKISLIILTLSSALSAELNVYLIPRYDYNESSPEKKGIKLADISRIDGNPDEIASFSKITIPEKILSDGYIDRSEIINFVKSRYNGDLYVYGSSVKINRVKADSENADEIHEVKSGSSVSFVVINNGITIRSQGTAVESGKTGDTIQVKLKKSKTAKGKIVTDKIVELEL